MNCTLVTLHFAVAAAASRTLKLWTPDSELHLPGIDREEDGRILIENGLQSISTAISGKRNDETGEEQETRDNWIQHLCSIEYDRHVWHGSSQPLSTFCKVEIDFGWFWSQLLIYVGLWMVYESWEMGCIVLSAFQINLHSQQSKNWPEDLETAGLADPVCEQDTTTTSNWFQLILDFALQTETVLIGIVINFHQSLSIVQGSRAIFGVLQRLKEAWSSKAQNCGAGPYPGHKHHADADAWKSMQMRHHWHHVKANGQTHITHCQCLSLIGSNMLQSPLHDRT